MEKNEPNFEVIGDRPKGVLSSSLYKYLICKTFLASQRVIAHNIPELENEDLSSVLINEHLAVFANLRTGFFAIANVNTGFFRIFASYGYVCVDDDEVDWKAADELVCFRSIEDRYVGYSFNLYVPEDIFFDDSVMEDDNHPIEYKLIDNDLMILDWTVMPDDQYRENGEHIRCIIDSDLNVVMPFCIMKKPLMERHLLYKRLKHKKRETHN